MRCEIVHEAEAFGALKDEWDALAAQSDAGLFLAHRWLTAWWKAFRGVDQLWVLLAREGDRLEAAWPLHLKAPRSGGIKVSELRLLGDLGGAQRSLLGTIESSDRAMPAFTEALAREKGWDVLEVPVRSKRITERLEAAAGQHANLRIDH